MITACILWKSAFIKYTSVYFAFKIVSTALENRCLEHRLRLRLVIVSKLTFASANHLKQKSNVLHLSFFVHDQNNTLSALFLSLINLLC